MAEGRSSSFSISLVTFPIPMLLLAHSTLVTHVIPSEERKLNRPSIL